MVQDIEENIVENDVFWDVVVQLQTFIDDRVRQTFLSVKQATWQDTGYPMNIFRNDIVYIAIQHSDICNSQDTTS
jgi:hypothetical protein